MMMTKTIALILLGVYLVLMGLASMAEIAMSPMASNVVQLLAVIAGVLILVSVGKCIKDRK